MQPWKPLLLIVPAGLVLGIAAGAAMRPVPLSKDERPWPPSVRESASRIEPWRPIYQGAPQDLDPPGYSYRPDFDYDVFAWPDQTDRSAEYLAVDRDYGMQGATLGDRYGEAGGLDLPQTRRARAELAAADAAGAVSSAAGFEAEAAAPPTDELGPDAAAAEVVLPAVPPPLAQPGTAPAPIEAGQF